jgi:16S rRNA G966 N2-methylase RsmD
MVEASAAAARQLEAIIAKLHAAQQVNVIRGDALTTAQALAARFELIFLDPPYHQGWLEKILPVCAGLLADNGLVYAESERPLPADAAPAWLADWEVIRADKAGMVCYYLLRRKSRSGIQA